MSAELARRLIHSGADQVQVEAALFAASERGVSLTQAVNELFPELLELLERALDRSDAPAIHTVRALPDLVKRLPAGMCERLLAIPVHRDQRSQRVDVAAVDVLDAHVAKEFAFHLGVPIRVLRAPFVELVSALQRLQAGGTFVPGLSRFLSLTEPSNDAGRPEPAVRVVMPSDPPIPLVRKSLAPSRAPEGVESEAFPEAPAPFPDLTDDGQEEPVLSLRRPKALSIAVPEPAPIVWQLDLETAVANVERAEAPDQVVSALCAAALPLQVLVFAMRGLTFDVRGGSADLGTSAELKELRVPSGNGSPLDAAARLGFYLGPLPQMLALAPLDRRWSLPLGSDCYARAVNVSERPSLILLLSGFRDSTEASRRADALARAAGNALEQIVRLRKRG